MSTAPVSEPKVLANELAEYLDQRQQRRRLLPLAMVVGLLAGGYTTLFCWLIGVADGLRTVMIESFQQVPFGWLLTILWVVSSATLAVWLTQRYAPEAAGSGIPHIEAVLHRLRDLRWQRIISVKLIGGVLALGSGLVLGREGPSVQIGGAVGRRCCNASQRATRASDLNCGWSRSRSCVRF